MGWATNTITKDVKQKNMQEIYVYIFWNNRDLNCTKGHVCTVFTAVIIWWKKKHKVLANTHFTEKVIYHNIVVLYEIYKRRCNCSVPQSSDKTNTIFSAIWHQLIAECLDFALCLKRNYFNLYENAIHSWWIKI